MLCPHDFLGLENSTRSGLRFHLSKLGSLTRVPHSAKRSCYPALSNHTSGSASNTRCLTCMMLILGLTPNGLAFGFYLSLARALRQIALLLFTMPLGTINTAVAKEHSFTHQHCAGDW